MNHNSLSIFRKYLLPCGLIWIVSLLSFSLSFANDADDVQKELRQKAVKLFKDEKYIEATPLFSQLLSLNNKDTLLNYYYGSCLSMQPDVSPNGVGYLEPTLNSRKIPDDAWYYYARSLFYAGQYANAEAAFNRYLTTDDHDKLKVSSASNYVHNCESALALNKSRKAVAVVNEREISATNFFSNYEFPSGKGRVAPAADQFVSDVDRKSDESSTMFVSGNNQLILLAKQVKGSTTGKDIYIVRKQANGMWSAPVLAGSAVNSAMDEDYLFMDNNGRTVYFSSKGFNSIGGYDIFKTEFNVLTGEWSAPVNLGMPINTTGDDMLFVKQQEGNLAVYCTNDKCKAGRLFQRTLELPKSDDEFVTVHGFYKSLDQQMRRDARISIIRQSDRALITTTTTDPTTGQYEINLPSSQDYFIVVEGGGYVAHLERFIIPEGIDKENIKQSIVMNRVGMDESMQLKNYFINTGAIANSETAAPSEVLSQTLSVAAIDSAQLMEVNINNTRLMVVKPSVIKDNAVKVDNSKLEPVVKNENIEPKVKGAAIDNDLLRLDSTASIENEEKAEDNNQGFNTGKNSGSSVLITISTSSNKIKDIQPSITDSTEGSITEIDFDATSNVVNSDENAADSIDLVDFNQEGQDAINSREVTADISDQDLALLAIEDAKDNRAEHDELAIEASKLKALALEKKATAQSIREEMTGLAINDSIQRNSLESKALELEDGAKSNFERSALLDSMAAERLQSAEFSEREAARLTSKNANTASLHNKPQGPIAAHHLSSDSIVTSKGKSNDKIVLSSSPEGIVEGETTHAAVAKTTDLDDSLPLIADSSNAFHREFSVKNPLISSSTSSVKEKEQSTEVTTHSNVKGGKSDDLLGVKSATVDSSEFSKNDISIQSGKQLKVDEATNPQISNDSTGVLYAAENSLEKIQQDNSIPKVNIIDSTGLNRSAAVTAAERDVNLALTTQNDSKTKANKDSLVTDSVLLIPSYDLVKSNNISQDSATLIHSNRKSARLQDSSIVDSNNASSIDENKAVIPGKDSLATLIADDSKSNDKVFTADSLSADLKLSKEDSLKKFQDNHLVSSDESKDKISSIPQAVKETNTAPVVNQPISHLLNEAVNDDKNNHTVASIDASKFTYSVSSQIDSLNVLNANAGNSNKVSEGAIKEVENIRAQVDSIDDKSQLINTSAETRDSSDIVTNQRNEIKQESTSLDQIRLNENKAVKIADAKNYLREYQHLIDSAVVINHLYQNLVDSVDLIKGEKAKEKLTIAADKLNEIESELSAKAALSLSLARKSDPETVNSYLSSIAKDNDVNSEAALYRQDTVFTASAIYPQLQSNSSSPESFKPDNSGPEKSEVQDVSGFSIPVKVTDQSAYRTNSNSSKYKENKSSQIDPATRSKIENEKSIEKNQGTDKAILYPKHVQSEKKLTVNNNTIDTAVIDSIKINTIKLPQSNADQTSLSSEKNSALAAKDVSIQNELSSLRSDAINEFSKAVQFNKQAVEFREKYISLLNKADIDSDSIRKAELLKEANEYKFKSEISEREAKERYSRAQTITTAVDSLEKENESISAQQKAGSSNEPVNPAEVTNADISSVAVPIIEFPLTIGSGEAYTAEHPIPANVQLPEGLIFKVQIGAFRSPIPDGSFGGLSPVTAENTRPGWIRYCVGLYRTFEPANLVKFEMRKMGYKDAFVAVYFNGKRISLSEAEKILKATDEPDKIAYSGIVDKELSDLKKLNINSENTAAINDDVVISTPYRAELKGSENNVTTSDGVIEYAVQVGVYKTSSPPAILNSLAPIQVDPLKSGLFRFTSERYNNYRQADSTKSVAIKAGIKDAFIIAYRGGKKTALASIPLADRYSNSNSVSANVNVKASRTIDANISESPGKLESQNTITYRVQLGAFRQNVPYDVVTAFLKISGLGIDQEDDSRGLHIFYSGNFEQYNDAENAKKAIVESGVKDAFIVAFVNGEKTTVLRARQLIGR